MLLGEWGANIPLAQSYGLNISQLVPFARISIDASDFNYRNLVIAEFFLHQSHHFIDNFHNILSTLYIYTDLEYKSNSTFRDRIKKGISSLCFYGDVIIKAKRVKSDTSKPANSLKNLIRKYYDLATIVDHLGQCSFTLLTITDN